MSDLFGGGNRQQAVQPEFVGVTTPALRVQSRRLGESNFVSNVRRQPGSIGSLNLARIPEFSRELQGLRDQLRPGFGRLTEAATQRIRSQQQAAVSNLRENLARRRVLGAGFAQDALIRANREFAEQEALTAAQTALQEIQANADLIIQEGNVLAQGVQQEFAEAGLGQQQVLSMMNAVTQASIAEAQLESNENLARAQGIGNLIGTGLGLGVGLATTPLGGTLLGRTIGFPGGGGGVQAAGLGRFGTPGTVPERPVSGSSFIGSRI